MKWRYLGYSAHRGRASAQLQIVKESYQLSKRRLPAAGQPAAWARAVEEASKAGGTEMDDILDAWGVGNIDAARPLKFVSREHIARGERQRVARADTPSIC